MSELFLIKGALSTPIWPAPEELRVTSVETIRPTPLPVQAAAPAPSPAPAPAPAKSHQFTTMVDQLVSNLGMDRPTAERMISEKYPNVRKSYLREMNAQHDQQITDALKGKESTWDRMALAELLAETMGVSVNSVLCRVPSEPFPTAAVVQGSAPPDDFVNAYHAKLGSGATRGEALDAAMQAHPAGYRAWVTGGCQQKL
ncbi:hypothetical protein GC207_11295 [bacterium]|nr:hypothetical protein [bacterium]